MSADEAGTPQSRSETRPSALTSEMVRDAIERLRNAQPVYCGSPERPHVVHPKASGPTNCANCFRVIEVPENGPSKPGGTDEQP